MQLFKKTKRKIETTEQAMYLHGSQGVYKLQLFTIPLEAPKQYEKLYKTLQNLDDAISSLIITKRFIKLLIIIKGKDMGHAQHLSQDYKAQILANNEGIKPEKGYDIIKYLPRTRFISNELKKSVKIKIEEKKKNIILIKNLPDDQEVLLDFIEDILIIDGEIRLTLIRIDDTIRVAIMIILQENETNSEQDYRINEILDEYQSIEVMIITEKRKIYESNISLGISPFLLNTEVDTLKDTIIQLLRFPKQDKKITVEKEPYPMAESINIVHAKKDESSCDDPIVNKIKEHIITNLLNEGYSIINTNKNFSFVMKKGNLRFAFDFIEKITEDVILTYKNKRKGEGDQDLQIILIYKEDETENIDIDPDNSIAFLHYKQILENIKE